MDALSGQSVSVCSQVVFEARVPALGIVRYTIIPLKHDEPTSEFEFPSTIELYNARSASTLTNAQFKIDAHPVGSCEKITLANEFYKLTLSCKTGQLEV